VHYVLDMSLLWTSGQRPTMSGTIVPSPGGREVMVLIGMSIFPHLSLDTFVVPSAGPADATADPGDGAPSWPVVGPAPGTGGEWPRAAPANSRQEIHLGRLTEGNVVGLSALGDPGGVLLHLVDSLPGKEPRYFRTDWGGKTWTEVQIRAK
jgi:hypothetical protein